MKKPAKEMTLKELAQYIDYSILKPEFTQQEIIEETIKAVNYGCKTVCINPSAIDLVRDYLEDSDTQLCVVCDFPFGSSSTESKVLQAKEICKQDIFELDVVANYGWIRSHRWEDVTHDIRAVVDACHEYNVDVKVIFETDALTSEEVVKAIQCAIEAGCDFVKTSTGFFTGINLNAPKSGAFREQIQLMLDTAQNKIKVKGSGGIRDRQHFLDLIDMGIERMGVGYKSVPVVLGVEG